MNSWRDMICRIIHKGIEKGEIRPDVDADEVVTIPISTLEGAVMMSKLYGDPIHLKRVINHLTDYIETNCECSASVFFGKIRPFGLKPNSGYNELGQIITEKLSIPTIGIGSGRFTDADFNH